GYIPTHSILPILTTTKYGIIILDNFSNSLPSAISRVRLLVEMEWDKAGIPVSNRPPIYFEKCDIRERTVLEQRLGKYRRSNGQSRIVSCLHFAALKSISESLRRPRDYYDVNVTGTLNLISVLEKMGCKKMVFSSSVVVYGKLEGMGKDVRLKEEMRIVGKKGGEITNPYGRSKLMCEEILNDLCAADPDWRVVILRYANPSGCHPSGLIGENPLEATNLMPTVSLVVQGRKPFVKIYGTRFDTPDGTGVRDFCHVMDIADAHYNALSFLENSSMLKENCRTYNLGTGRGVSVLEIIETLSKISQSPIKTVLENPRAGDLASVVCDPSKAERELGWKAKRSLLDMCRDQWVRFPPLPLVGVWRFRKADESAVRFGSRRTREDTNKCEYACNNLSHQISLIYPLASCAYKQ
ncbi:UDP-glucose 4-epimerase, partial [Atractiella rhizophila]